jgi:hypothetical protein
MNIFKLDNCPSKSAKYHHEGHITKLILETSQLCSSAVRSNNLNLNNNIIYKIAYPKHPCTLACINSREIFIYTCILGLELNRERVARYQKPEHASAKVLQECLKYEESIPDNKIAWPLAMPEQYKRDDPVESYRSYYIYEKTTNKSGRWMMYYYPQNIPDWIPFELKAQIQLEELIKYGETTN